MNTQREEALERPERPAAPPSPPPAMARELQLASAIGNRAFAALMHDRKVPEGTPQDDSELVTDFRRLQRQPPEDGGTTTAEPAGGGSGGTPPVLAAVPLTVKLTANVRGTSSPAGMADRIPPRVGTSAHVDVSGLKAGDPPVKLSIEGAGGGNGTATIDGAATKDITASGDVTLSGVDQTDVGKGGSLKLVAKQGAATVAASAGFSVSAIPQNYTDVFARLITGASRGFFVKDSWESDSGVVADLKETQISELVEVTSATGCFSGTGKSNSGYLAGDKFSEDEHGTPVSILTGKGNRVAQQTCMFKDKRSGSTDIPMTNSGYTLTRDVREKGAGKLEIQTTKVGAKTTANSVPSDAGAGSIDKLQDV
jgi:hypothetical protein